MKVPVVEQYAAVQRAERTSRGLQSPALVPVMPMHCGGQETMPELRAYCKARQVFEPLVERLRGAVFANFERIRDGECVECTHGPGSS